jgi:hypothetical protein
MYALSSQHSIKNPCGVYTAYYCIIFLQFADTKMDVKNMSDFESGSFDAVIDKGTMPCNTCQHYRISLHAYTTWL